MNLNYLRFFLAALFLAVNSVYPNPPQNLNHQIVGDTSVELSWELPEDFEQELVFHESFEGLNDATFPPGAWLNVDNDGDGIAWILFDVPYNEANNPYPAYHGEYAAASYSWFDGNVLTPENWLITPALTLNENTLLQWAVAAQRPNFSQEHYKVFLSTSGTDVEDFDILLHEETLPDQDITWKLRQVDLSEHEGEEIHIAFVHTQTTNLFAIKIDDIRLYELSDNSLEAFKVYRNGTEIAYLEDITALHFTDAELVPGLYEYHITAIINSEESAPSNTINVYITGPEIDAAPQNLRAELSGETISIQWDEPAQGNTIFLYENFEGLTDATFPPANWQNTDNDGDGNAWILFDAPLSDANPYPAYDGDFAAASYSWFNGATLTPDNWLITPAIHIGNNTQLSWAVAAQRPNFSQEHYKVFLSTAGAEVSDFTVLLHEETMPAQDITWKTRNVDLAEYAGENIHIAFVHSETTDLFAIKIDAIKLEGESNLNLTAYQVFRNNELIAEIDAGETTQYMDEEIASGDWEYYVKAVYQEGISKPSESVLIKVRLLSLFVSPEEGGNATGGKLALEGEEIDIMLDIHESFLFKRWVNAQENIISEIPDFSYIMGAENTELTALLDQETSSFFYSEQLKIYPNPAQNHLTFESSKPIQKISLLDTQGKLLSEINLSYTHRNILNIGELNSGIFVIQIQFEDNTTYKTVVVKE